MKMFAAVGVLIQKQQQQKQSKEQQVSSLYQEQYLTQAQIAHRLNINQSTVSRIINKIGLPKIKRSYCIYKPNSTRGRRCSKKNGNKKAKKKHWY